MDALWASAKYMANGKTSVGSNLELCCQMDGVKSSPINSALVFNFGQMLMRSMLIPFKV